ncbi:MAG: nucleotidyltransferase domain-containing protein [Clostridia bacterium]|nr:nucleotidyltransferase domain-containing protein [Clostridia bacterium]
MIDIYEYINSLITECRADFGDRLVYVGLQGSYLRGEANENSDIDIMFVLDSLSVADMDRYRTILLRIGHFEKSCGFICGRDELMRWNPLEVCQLKHTTKDILGSLDELLPQAARQDEVNYVKFSLGNLYHELCHRYIHAERSKNEAKLRGSCKALYFLIQNLHYLESGDFVLKKSELMERVSGADREMLAMAELKDDFDFDKAFYSVFNWCKKAFIRIESIECNHTED